MSESSQAANIFAMFQKNPKCYYSGVRIDFTQIKDHSQSIAKGQNVFKKIIPSYNNDGLHYTDAFILESDSTRKSTLQANPIQSAPDEGSRQKFESKVQKQNANMEIEEIYPAQPDSFFCQICRAPFENYIEHIQDKNHTRNLEFSKGHKFIKQICKQAKKILHSHETDNLSSLSFKNQINKPISQNKVVPKNQKKKDKCPRKTTNKKGSSKKAEIQDSQEKQSEDLKKRENEELVSIIKGQMKLSAVENSKIQNMD